MQKIKYTEQEILNNNELSQAIDNFMKLGFTPVNKGDYTEIEVRNVIPSLLSFYSEVNVFLKLTQEQRESIEGDMQFGYTGPVEIDGFLYITSNFRGTKMSGEELVYDYIAIEDYIELTKPLHNDFII